MDSPEILLWGGMWELGASVFVRATSFQAPGQGGCMLLWGVNKMAETSHAVVIIALHYLTVANRLSGKSVSRMRVLNCGMIFSLKSNRPKLTKNPKNQRNLQKRKPVGPILLLRRGIRIIQTSSFVIQYFGTKIMVRFSEVSAV